MGSGKSTLLAQAVLESTSRFRNTDSGTCIYFFCEKTRGPCNKKGEDFSTVYRSLLKQLLGSGHDSVLPSVLDKYQSRKLDGRALTRNETRDLLVQAAVAAKNLVVIIDALDECDQAMRTALLHDLQRIQENTNTPVRVLVSSRWKSDIAEALDSTSAIEMDNADDIVAYVEASVQTNLENRIFRPELGRYVFEITETIIQKSSGT